MSRISLCRWSTGQPGELVVVCDAAVEDGTGRVHRLSAVERLRYQAPRDSRFDEAEEQARARTTGLAYGAARRLAEELGV